MFLRFNRRFKDGKEHRYWNIVANKRCARGKVVPVLYLGEINDSQARSAGTTAAADHRGRHARQS